MIFAASEPPQYIVMPLNEGKTGDMVYMAKNLRLMHGVGYK